MSGLVDNHKIFFNPFSLELAKSGIMNGSNLFSKCIYGTVGALKDIYIKNPYKITVGNLAQIGSCATAWGKVARIGVAFAGTCYTLMLYGGSIGLLGKVVKKIPFPYAKDISSKTEKLGEIVFLTGAVPLTGICYFLPKKIIESIPSCITFLKTYAVLAYHKAINIGKWTVRLVKGSIEGIIKKIDSLVHWTFNNLLKPFFNNFLKLLYQNIVKACNYALGKLSLGIKWIGDRIINLVSFVFNKVLTPFWNRCVVPFAKAIARGFDWVIKTSWNVLTTVMKKTVEIFEYAFNNILKPLGRFVVSVVKSIANIIENIVSFTFRRILIPFWNRCVVPIARAIIRGFNWSLKTSWNVLTTVIKKTVELFEYAFKNILKPLGRFIFSAVRSTANIIENIVSFTFRRILIPFWNMAIKGCGIFKKGFYSLLGKSGQILKFCANQITNLSMFIKNNTIVPFWKYIVIPAFEITKTAFHCSFNLICNVTSLAIKKTGELVSFIFTKGILPFVGFIKRMVVGSLTMAGNFVVKVWNSVLVPIGTFVSQTVSYVGDVIANLLKSTFNNYILPVALFIKNTTVAVGSLLSKTITTSSGYLSKKVSQFMQFIIQDVLVPLGIIIGKAKDSVIEHVYEIGNKISDIWHMIQNFFNGSGFKEHIA